MVRLRLVLVSASACIVFGAILICAGVDAFCPANETAILVKHDHDVCDADQPSFVLLHRYISESYLHALRK